MVIPVGTSANTAVAAICGTTPIGNTQTVASATNEQKVACQEPSAADGKFGRRASAGLGICCAPNAVLRWESDNCGLWRAGPPLVLVTSLNREPDGDVVDELICKVFYCSSNQITDRATIDERSSLQRFELSRVQSYVDLALCHDARFRPRTVLNAMLR
jgi:hypothetical protein